MSVGVAAPAFVAGAVVSLTTSWVLVSRLERISERFGLTEALLGVVAALAADAPEVTAAVTALSQHEQGVGAGVVIGSNVFNLAALLGLGAVVAGRIDLHRRVVLLSGAVAIWVAGLCLAVVIGALTPIIGLVVASLGVAIYFCAVGAGERGHRRLHLPQPWIDWLGAAVAEENLEAGQLARPARGQPRDMVVAGGALGVVVIASVVMERAAATLGRRYAVPEIVVGGLVLAAVTSLPNAVAAVYLAVRGRGPATLSTALNSNTFNVLVGLFLPGAILGFGSRSVQSTLVAAWYAGLTVIVLAFAYLDRGISRTIGIVIVGSYAVFVVSVLATARSSSKLWVLWVPAVMIGAVVVAGLYRRRRSVTTRGRTARGDQGLGATLEPGRSSGPDGESPDAAVLVNGCYEPSIIGGQPRTGDRRSGRQSESLIPGWSPKQIWILSASSCCFVAAIDAVVGHRLVLVGFLIAGPCGALLTARWTLTGLAGLCAIGLAVALCIPDGIWASSTQVAFLAAIGLVSLIATAAAALIELKRSP